MSDRKKGFMALPTSLKILFIIIILNLISSLTGLLSGQTNAVPIAGVILDGTAAVVLTGIIGLLIPGLILYSFWERESWAWIFALAALVLSIVNSLLAIPVLEQVIVGALPPDFPADMIPVQLQIATISTYVTSAITALFAWFVYANRKYFKG